MRTAAVLSRFTGVFDALTGGSSLFGAVQTSTAMEGFLTPCQITPNGGTPLKKDF